MFSFDSDKKKELEDNMEDIKDLINKKDEGNHGEPETREEAEVSEENDFADPAGFDEQENIEEPQPSDFKNTSDSQSQVEQQSQDNRLESFDSQGQESSSPEEPAQKELKQGSEPQRDVQSFSEEDFQTEDSRQNQDSQADSRTRNESNNNSGSGRKALERDIPEPAKTKDINVPEIEKGPLFIRQKKFEAAVSMIQEMRYLSREIEDVVNHLEQGIREDEKTEREARELLHNLEEDRSGVKDIISPQKKM